MPSVLLWLASALLGLVCLLSAPRADAAPYLRAPVASGLGASSADASWLAPSPQQVFRADRRRAPARQADLEFPLELSGLLPEAVVKLEPVSGLLAAPADKSVARVRSKYLRTAWARAPPVTPAA